MVAFGSIVAYLLHRMCLTTAICMRVVFVCMEVASSLPVCSSEVDATQKIGASSLCIR